MADSQNCHRQHVGHFTLIIYLFLLFRYSMDLTEWFLRVESTATLGVYEDIRQGGTPKSGLLIHDWYLSGFGTVCLGDVYAKTGLWCGYCFNVVLSTVDGSKHLWRWPSTAKTIINTGINHWWYCLNVDLLRHFVDSGINQY